MAHPFSPSDDMPGASDDDNNSELERSGTPDEVDAQMNDDASETIEAGEPGPNEADAIPSTSMAPQSDDETAEYDEAMLDSEPNDTDSIPPALDPEEELDQEDDGLDGIDEVDESEEELEGFDEADENEAGFEEFDESDEDEIGGDDESGDDELDGTGESGDDEPGESDEDDAESGIEDMPEEIDADLPEATFSANVFLIGVPKGNRDDITLRAIHTLQSVDLVVCEEFKSAARLLRNHNIAKKVIEIAGNNEEPATKEVVAQIRAGKRVAILVEAGVPVLTDPGSLLAEKLREMNIEPRIIPGVSLVLTGLMASGFDMGSFEMVGFLPRKPEERRQAALDLASRPSTLGIVESPFRLRSLLTALADAMPSRRAAMAINLTTPFEVIIRGTLAQLNEKFSGKRFKGEFVVVLDALTQAEQAGALRVSRALPHGGNAGFGDEDDRGAMSGAGSADPEEGGWSPVKKHARSDRDDDRRGSFGDRPQGGFGDKRGGYNDRKEGFDGPRRDDRPSGGFGDKRRDDRPSGGFGDKRPGGFGDKRGGGFGDKRGGGGFGGPRRDDRPSGGFGGPRRDDRQGGGFGDKRPGGFGGPRRDDRPSGGFGGPRRDDRPSGGFGDKRSGGFGGPRRDDRPSGGFGDKRPGGFGGPRRDDRQGGGFGDKRPGGFGGPRRDDRPGGGFGGSRRDDRPGGGFGGPRGGSGGGGGRFNDRPREERGDRPSGGGFGRDDRGGSGGGFRGNSRGGGRPGGGPGGDRRSGGGGFGRGPRKGPGR